MILFPSYDDLSLPRYLRFEIPLQYPLEFVYSFPLKSRKFGLDKFGLLVVFLLSEAGTAIDLDVSHGGQ